MSEQHEVIEGKSAEECARAVLDKPDSVTNRRDVTEYCLEMCEKTLEGLSVVSRDAPEVVKLIDVIYELKSALKE